MTSERISPVWGTILLTITTGHCDRSAAIQTRVVVATTVLLLTLAASASAKYSGGTGEPNDPYQIATAEDLMLLDGVREGHFILTDDIDLDPNLPGRKVFDKAVIGAAPPRFVGVFDGNGHTISHLTINGAGHLGLFGELDGAEIKDLGVVDVNITGSGSHVGALVGCTHFPSTVTNCYSTGKVTGESYVGGLVGVNEEAYVTQCYSNAEVIGVSHVGGLVGLNYEGAVTQCYSAGAVSGTGSYVGGLVGRFCYGRNGEEDCFWDIETSGQATSAGGTGKTTAQMQTAKTFLDAGWAPCDGNAIWTIDEGNDYPRLWWENKPGEPIAVGANLSDVLTGAGTEDSPYLIYTADELNLIGLFPCEWDKHFKLMANVDLSGYLYDGGLVGADTDPSSYGYQGPSFTGDFDGNGHTISHLSITGGRNLGLFAQLESGAEVKNLGVVDVNITGSDYCAGGLVGRNSYGSITNCYSTGTVSGDSSVAGLVGSNYQGTVTHCYSTCTVSGNDYVGGLVGYNHGKIGTSYSTGTVEGVENVGGLLGWNDRGSIGTSFWDIQTSDKATSDGGTGKTTAEMQTAQTFLEAGWDFVGETTNGTEDIWKIAEGLGYPRLSWEKYSGGTGELNDPYQIATAADLITLGDTPEDYDKHFILTADIDLDPNLPGRKVFDKAVIAPDTDPNDQYSEFQGTPFTGVFDGNAHKILHLFIGLTVDGRFPSIVDRDFLGLFGTLRCWAEVRDLGVVDINIAGRYYVGSLVGSNARGVNVTRCYATGRVTGNYNVGGLVGDNWGGITKSYSTVMVTATGQWPSSAGGLVGSNGGTVTQCYSTGLVSSTGQWSSAVGGLVGYNGWGDVTACFWDIQTSGQAISDGGTGKTTAEMEDIQIYQDAGWDFVGEIANGTHETWQMPEGGGYPVLTTFGGYTPPELQGMGTVEDPYLISDALELGAMVHYSPFACYRLAASIDLSGIRWDTAVIPLFAGTFDGNNLTISHLTVAGYSNLGLFGRLGSEAEVKNLAVVDVNITGSGYHVGALVGSNDGNVNACYSTGTVSATEVIGGLVGSNDGDLTGCYSTGAVSGGSYVGGLVGGNGGSILTSYSTGTVSGYERVGGLVGYNWRWDNFEATVTLCHSTGAVNGTSYVGGLVGSNSSGSITHCYSTGPVKGKQWVGGLVGSTDHGAVIHSYSTGAVTGGSYVGGLVGANYRGAVTQCYSTAAVSGEEQVGGLMGHTGEGRVTHCYSTGVVSGTGYCVGGLVGYSYSGGVRGQPVLVADCFWDTKTSGQATSAGGTGKTTAEMQTASTFLEAGWDFVGETANGTEDIWWINEGKDYPRLWWEGIEQ